MYVREGKLTMAGWLSTLPDFDPLAESCIACEAEPGVVCKWPCCYATSWDPKFLTIPGRPHLARQFDALVTWYRGQGHSSDSAYEWAFNSYNNMRT